MSLYPNLPPQRTVRTLGGEPRDCYILEVLGSLTPAQRAQLEDQLELVLERYNGLTCRLVRSETFDNSLLQALRL